MKFCNLWLGRKLTFYKKNWYICTDLWVVVYFLASLFFTFRLCYDENLFVDEFDLFPFS